MSVLQASNTPTDIDEHGSLASARWRWFSFEPRQIGWLSAAVLFVGTLFFGVSLVAAFAEDLTPRQSNGWIWVPDIVGCVCFLVSGHLALVEVGHGRIWRVVNDLGWWIVGVNQLGSILFFLAGIAAFTRPATSTALDLGPGQLGDLRRRGVLRGGRGAPAVRAAGTGSGPRLVQIGV